MHITNWHLSPKYVYPHLKFHFVPCAYICMYIRSIIYICTKFCFLVYNVVKWLYEQQQTFLPRKHPQSQCSQKQVHSRHPFITKDPCNWPALWRQKAGSSQKAGSTHRAASPMKMFGSTEQLMERMWLPSSSINIFRARTLSTGICSEVAFPRTSIRTCQCLL